MRILFVVKLRGLEDVLEKTPFQSFDIHVDGKTVTVEYPDQVLFAFGRTTIVVAPRDEHIHIIDLDQIQFLTVHRRRKASR